MAKKKQRTEKQIIDEMSFINERLNNMIALSFEELASSTEYRSLTNRLKVLLDQLKQVQKQ